MARYTERNKLEREGLSFRKLEVGGESGFLLRVVDKDLEPPKVTTIAQQPGQDTVTTQSLLFVRSGAQRHWSSSWRYDPPVPTEPESQYRIVEILEAIGTPLAETALQHLVTAPSETD